MGMRIHQSHAANCKLLSCQIEISIANRFWRELVCGDAELRKIIAHLRPARGFAISKWPGNNASDKSQKFLTLFYEF
jgi:hypothetical protein